ncbi:DUF1456 family protein [Pseudocolwellia agarivorans]|uniref:DUF1456 family protein n=1 Tax=Pseudocolwellia agarivorans TaxID=1911682 RepID=UPI003F88424B
MINNVILRRVCNIFDFNNDKVCSIFELGQCQISTEQLTQIFIEKNDPTYKELLDVELAAFLNGLIEDQRGPSDGPKRDAEDSLNNNAIFNKLKIALSLKADEVLAILELGKITLSKYELSAFFRNVNHKNYKECSDDVLSAFLSGLKIKHEQ